MREFNSIVSFAEQCSLPVSAKYSTAGKPLIIQVEDDLFSSEFVLATISDTNQLSSASSSTQSIIQQTMQTGSAIRQNQSRFANRHSLNGTNRRLDGTSITQSNLRQLDDGLSFNNDLGFEDDSFLDGDSENVDQAVSWNPHLV